MYKKYVINQVANYKILENVINIVVQNYKIY